MKFLLTIFKFFLYALCAIGILTSVLFGHRDIPIEHLTAQYAQKPSAFAKIDGMNVHYRDEGVATDTLPMVLIHGTSSSLHTFDAWTKELSVTKRVVRMDLPGFGLTGAFPNRDYTMANYVKFIEKFLENRGIQQCILAGNSLGGQVAWHVAFSNPRLIKKLILIDAAGYPLQSKSVPIGFVIAKKPILNQLMTFLTPRFMVKSSVENVYADKTKVSDALVDRYFDLTLRAGNRQALVDRLTTAQDTSEAVKIKSIQQPTLVLWGEQDELITTASAQRFHRDLPNDTLVILKNMGHVPMEENPNESLKVVLGFLSEKL
jgi:pimeloyl-ACP methyl ester carboxylesterase